MKKTFLVLFVAGLFASCDNAADNAEEQLKDSLDSVKNLKVESVEDAAEQAIDTIKQNTDSLKERVEDVTDAVKDTMKKDN
jgi:PBP1b-binding outer membrane lipoprotein LpoB